MRSTDRWGKRPASRREKGESPPDEAAKAAENAASEAALAAAALNTPPPGGGTLLGKASPSADASSDSALMAELKTTEVLDGNASLWQVLRPRDGGKLVLAPSGTGKTVLVKLLTAAGRTDMLDADVVASMFLARPQLETSGGGEKVKHWRDDPDLMRAVNFSANAACIKAARESGSTVLSGWLGAPFDWLAAMGPIRFVVMRFRASDILKRANNPDGRRMEGHIDVTTEQAAGMESALNDYAREVENAGIGIALTPKDTLAFTKVMDKYASTLKQ